MAGSTYVNTLLQCSPTSVGLAQARPNHVANCKWHNGSKLLLLLQWNPA